MRQQSSRKSMSPLSRSTGATTLIMINIIVFYIWTLERQFYKNKNFNHSCCLISNHILFQYLADDWCTRWALRQSYQVCSKVMPQLHQAITFKTEQLFITLYAQTQSRNSERKTLNRHQMPYIFCLVTIHLIYHRSSSR